MAALVVAVSGSAEAQWGFNAALGVGATNNATGATNQGAGGTDGVTRTTVGAAYLSRGPRSSQQIAYTFGSYLYTSDAAAVSIMNDLVYQAVVNPSPFSELGLTLSGAQGRTNDFNFISRQALGASVARPVGNNTFVTANGGQHLSWQLGPFWSMGELFTGRYFTPVGDVPGQAWAWGTDAQLALLRNWYEDSAGIQVHGGHGGNGPYTLNNISIPKRQANFGDAQLTWDHTFTRDTNMHLGAGVLGVEVPQNSQPLVDFSADLTFTYYTRTGGEIGLRANRGIYTNVYVGDVLLQNSIGLRALYPFGYQDRWSITGQIDYQRAHSIYVVDVNETGLDVFNTAGTLTYEYSRIARLLLEGSYTYQDAQNALRNTMFVPAYTLNRVLLMATLEIVYPEPDPATRQIGRRPRARLGGGAAPGSPIGEAAGSSAGVGFGSDTAGLGGTEGSGARPKKSRGATAPPSRDQRGDGSAD